MLLDYYEFSSGDTTLKNAQIFDPLFSDDMDQDAMADGGLDDMMEAELANMAERDAEVEMVMAEFDAGDAGGMDNAD